jgi:hypothetical protein
MLDFTARKSPQAEAEGLKKNKKSQGLVRFKIAPAIVASIWAMRA